MTIEQVFRDSKSRRYGWALRNIQVTKADRFDRLLLILVFAYVLLVGLGHYCRVHLSSACWSTNTRPTNCSAFTIDRAMVNRLDH